MGFYRMFIKGHNLASARNSREHECGGVISVCFILSIHAPSRMGNIIDIGTKGG